VIPASSAGETMVQESDHIATYSYKQAGAITEGNMEHMFQQAGAIKVC